MQRKLFDVPKKPRQPNRILMHVIDAGPFDDGEDNVKFGCSKCGQETEWKIVKRSVAKYGVPCPKCN